MSKKRRKFSGSANPVDFSCYWKEIEGDDLRKIEAFCRQHAGRLYSTIRREILYEQKKTEISVNPYMNGFVKYVLNGNMAAAEGWLYAAKYLSRLEYQFGRSAEMQFDLTDVIIEKSKVIRTIAPKAKIQQDTEERLEAIRPKAAKVKKAKAALRDADIKKAIWDYLDGNPHAFLLDRVGLTKRLIDAGRSFGKIATSTLEKKVGKASSEWKSCQQEKYRMTR